MAPRRVAVTGLGVICALGHDISCFWNCLCAGRSAIRPIEAVDVSGFRFQNGAEVRGYDPARHFEPAQADLLDRFAQFALIAARQAVQDSGIGLTSELRQRTAIITGSSVGGQSSEDEQFFAVYRNHSPRVHPLTIPRIMANAGASHISMEFGICGPAFTVSTACASSNHAIGQAFWMVRDGTAELAIAGGSETPFSFGFLKAWEAMRVVSPDTCRPFSRDRRGLILGEGAGMVVLEPLERAQARGAPIYAEITGFGMSADAGHITTPSAEGPARAMTAALRDAGITPEQVGYINAHGTGTPNNDSTETRALHQTFGAHAEKLALSSTKSMHGHALGAAGALEAVTTILALHHAILPPTANFTTPDPDCDLDIIPNQARAVEVEYALSNTFAFGGLNAVLAFRRQ
jgi:nodulation protein E